MKCKACNSEVNPQSKFCHKCGERIDPLDENDQPAKPAVKTGTPAERIRNAGPANDVADDKEDDLWEGRYSGKAMIGNWLLGGLATIALLIGGAVLGESWMWILVGVASAVIWVGLLLMMLYRKLSVKYELTTQRFIHYSGILSRTTDRIEAIDMDDVSFRQNLFERMVGVGTVKILSSDTSHPELTLRGIDEVKRIADMIDDVRRKERRRRGLYVESV